MSWRIEVWVAGEPHGQWRFVGETDDMAFAKEGVEAIAGQYGLARALLTNPEEGGWCGMIAYKDKGFCCWTGSGGLYSP